MYFNGTDFFGPTVILISLDGFRSEYLHRNITPNLDELASKGIRAEYMHPSFPPSTFPNHWTLVTGLYPEAHGIVGNTFYDPALDKEFIYNNNEITKQSEWWGGEPLWVTSALQGLRTAVDMWPGSTASVNHVRPNFVVGFNSTVTPLEKIDTVLGWLDLAQNERPQFMAVYVPQVDIVGHEKGPDSEEINDAIIDVDNAIGHLIEELTERNLGRHVHVIVVSDHGMSSTGPSKLIYYDDILSPESLASLREREAMPLLDIRPNANASFDRMVNKIYRELHNYTENSPDPHFKVFLRKDVPSRYHYSNTDRITPIVAIPDVGYTFVLHDEVAPNAQKTFLTLGHHGYDNLAPDMRAIFIAKGPKLNLRFNHGAVVIPFFNVEVYGLITELLNIVAAPNNGTLQGGFFATSLTH
ncbi:hypothetical protein PHYBLDRAFT_156134 [Phycomyces blakesleeanus NRRL 1555(-)]|uniref:Uncharacterized protein n=2 Tax=Phycomyces blakesleeanus TaxID=4837 RepID=A0A167L4I3_PHYB8|nr:hypothetical protein PHYBLDRAFT_156134 [Phycomyces blakesleeanus NRRL 1555(-)]OAD69578.1 hypothetical protein PHYBLDRAFT_156134 [Phycomyces blakesleeanus NRRL 1555(-)]|eukprot:XP_018287618.1 hypothetical protein PHYBLDRAFT_156134 [Phycomyces blakesleeanus NRRL 1555(-)]